MVKYRVYQVLEVLSWEKTRCQRKRGENNGKPMYKDSTLGIEPPTTDAHGTKAIYSDSMNQRQFVPSGTRRCAAAAAAATAAVYQHTE